MSSGDSASETHLRWKCSHDMKTRVASTVGYYAKRLRGHLIDIESAQLWAGVELPPPEPPATTTVVDQDAGSSSPPPPSSSKNDSQQANSNNNNGDQKLDDDVASTPATPSLQATQSAKKPQQQQLTNAQLMNLSIAMARKSVQNPPSFLIPEDDPEPLPAHCVHFDILSAPALKSAISAVTNSFNKGDNKPVAELENMLTKGTSDFHTAIFAFADHPSVCSGDVGDDRDEIVQCFNKLSSLSSSDFGVKWSRRVRDVCDMIERNQSNFVKQRHTLLFDSLQVANTRLLDRCVAWLLLTVPALNTEALQRVCRLLTLAEESDLTKILGRISPQSMSIIVESLQSSFTIALFQAESLLTGTHAHLNLLGAVLSLFHKANTAIVTRGLIKYSEFYNAEAISYDEDNIVRDFKRWMKVQGEPSSQLFSFSRFPCLVDTRFKSKLLQFEGIVTHHQAQQEAMVRLLFSAGRRQQQQVENEMYCVLNVKRDDLLGTTVRELSRNHERFKKPLKVVFIGEQGIDAGGVTKEFFQLITKQLFNPGFGMFEEKEANRVLWLMPDVSTEYLRQELHILGQILGLAAYNNVIIDVSFPQVLYRKILGQHPDIEDLRELDPGMANGLEKLLEWDEQANGVTVEDAFCRTFTFEHDVFGSTVEVELCQGGKDRTLTIENRREYVNLMLEYLLVDGVKKSFKQFSDGFLSVTSSRGMISTMHSQELEMLLCGQKSLDFEELEESCSYEGYEGDEPVIKWFWSVLRNALTTEQQKRFLHFATGSDRVPVGGLKELKFKIGKNGDIDAQLPTAHTCFNHLLLPEYSSEETLKQKLLLAIENCEGFGLQ